MKFSKSIFTFLLLMSCAFFFTACNQSSTSDNTSTEGKKGKEYTSAYICPMHCAGSGSDAAGKCPTCGMDYVANMEHPANKRQAPESTGHEGHDHSHDGHDHSDHEGHNH